MDSLCICVSLLFVCGRYLEEAVMNLDTSNPVTQGHMRGVLIGLIQKLKTYITAHPNDKTTRSLRMLQMASESLLKWKGSRHHF